MNRRRLLVAVAGVTLPGVAGCTELESGDDTTTAAATDTPASDQTDTEPESPPEEEPTDDDETGDTDVGRTEPAAVVDQFRVALIEADIDTYNQLIYDDGPLDPLEAGELEPAENLESIELTIEEITPSTYKSRSEEAFDRQQAEARLSEIGADEFAIVWWEEQYRAGQDVPIDSLAVYLLYRVDSDWLLYEALSGSEQIAVEDIDEPTPPFANSPTGVVEQFYVGALTGDVDAANEVLYPESPQEQVTDDDVRRTDRRAIVGAEERSVEGAAEAASFSSPEELERAGLLAQDRYGVEYQFVVVSTASKGDSFVEQVPVLTVRDDGDWFVHRSDFN
jgi:hypothetical protein